LYSLSWMLTSGMMLVTVDSRTLETPGEYSTYFVVSYAHSPVIAENPDADRWVGTFFSDLENEVKRYASPRSGAIHGFFDQRIPPDSDWKESLSRALGRAQVFVPLYSVLYFQRSLPGREWACYRQRLESAGQRDPELRFMPVLWTPLLGTRDAPGLRKALALGRDVPGYAKNGLRPMLRIKSYHDSYRAIVNLLAKEIVTVAEESPIRSSEVPDIDEMRSAFAPGSPLAIFAIETVTPTGRAVATGRDHGRHGDGEWRPFPEQDRSLAQYVRQVVERFDFQAEVGELDTDIDPATRRPGIILIDPWFIADETGQSMLKSAVKDLPRWVLPLTVLDQPDNPRIWELAGRVMDILGAAKALHTDSSRLAAEGVSSLNDFLAIVPRLVNEAERQYLKYRSGRVRSQPSGRRPSLRRPPLEQPASSPDKQASAQDSWGETPDD
jgi:FxsC-like protein